MNKVIKVPERGKKITETQEERLERIRLWPTTRTRVVPSRKTYKRKSKHKEEFKKADEPRRIQTEDVRPL